jgi:hypothetical protein
LAQRLSYPDQWAVGGRPSELMSKSLCNPELGEDDLIDHYAGIPEKVEGVIRGLGDFGVACRKHPLSGAEGIASFAGDLAQPARSRSSLDQRHL